MALIEVKIPSPGESISHVEIYKWLVEEGDIVKKNMDIAEIESEKATLTLVAEASGKIALKVKEGDSVEVGAVACTIDTSVAPEENASESAGEVYENKAEENIVLEADVSEPDDKTKEPDKTSQKTEKETILTETDVEKEKKEFQDVKTSPLARSIMQEHDLSVEDVINGLRRLTRQDIEAVLASNSASDDFTAKKDNVRTSKTNRMSALRRKLSERLVSVKNETAMLTTFNEVDMKPIMELRKKHQSRFVEKHDVKLGIMSFFLKACALALKEFPQVNSMIEDDSITSFDYADISVAVSTPKGLMVPVIRNVENKTLAEIEKAILEVAEKARTNKLSIPEMTGGTFTVTNGGVFGSMMSTPIINPPQSAILGMHNILERPVVVDGQITIRPMMYVALSYDHRVIDGRESVSFLVRVKELLENPTNMIFSPKDGEKLLLDL